MAMALAELGEYTRAAGVQRDVIKAAQKAGLSDDVQRMEVNLRLYEDRRPCRTPWIDEDPLKLRKPPADAAALESSLDASPGPAQR